MREFLAQCLQILRNYQEQQKFQVSSQLNRHLAGLTPPSSLAKEAVALLKKTQTSFVQKILSFSLVKKVLLTESSLEETLAIVSYLVQEAQLSSEARPPSLVQEGQPSSLVQEGQPSSLVQEARPSSLVQEAHPVEKALVTESCFVQ